eukprot:992443-Pleurochrysis_carterae.AAC.1
MSSRLKKLLNAQSISMGSIIMVAPVLAAVGNELPIFSLKLISFASQRATCAADFATEHAPGLFLLSGPCPRTRSVEQILDLHLDDLVELLDLECVRIELFNILRRLTKHRKGRKAHAKVRDATTRSSKRQDEVQKHQPSIAKKASLIVTTKGTDGGCGRGGTGG